MLIEDGKENVMGKIEGIKIKNYGPIREVVLGRTLSHQKPEPLGNMITMRLDLLLTVSSWGLKRRVMRTIAADMIS